MSQAEKVRENRLRQKAKRMGLSVLKSRRRDPQALDFGLFMIVDAYTNGALVGSGPFGADMSLDDVETFLAERP